MINFFRKATSHKYNLIDPKIQVFGNIAILTLRYNSTNENLFLIRAQIRPQRLLMIIPFRIHCAKQ